MPAMFASMVGVPVSQPLMNDAVSQKQAAAANSSGSLDARSRSCAAVLFGAIGQPVRR